MKRFLTLIFLLLSLLAVTVALAACGEDDGGEHVHIPGVAVKENEVPATCEGKGSYDQVIRCTDCNEVLSSLTIETLPKGHKETEAVEENRVEPTCTKDGSYDSVVYCSDCNEVISSEHKVIATEGHANSDAVEENRVEPTCTKDGSYDSVVYCSVCKDEISRDTVTVKTDGHTPDEPVRENEGAPSCLDGYTYDSVVYCSVCKDEISREKITVDGKGHTPSTAVKENEKQPSCTEAGSYDSVVYCSVCKSEVSRATVSVAAPGHTHGEPVKENEKQPTCTEAGSYDSVVYCSVCKTEVSRTTVSVAATGHKDGEPVRENEIKATCKTEGRYDSVVYCTVCKHTISTTQVKEPVSSKHSVVNGKCTVCEAVESNAGLVFTPNPDGVSYTLSSLGTCADSSITIDLYQGYRVTAIAKDAFGNNATVKSIRISAYVTDVASGAFTGMTKLSTVSVDSNNPVYKSMSGNLYSKDGKTLIMYCRGRSVEKFVIPTDVTTVAENAFYGCSLTSVGIGEKLELIEENAFASAENLKKVFYEGSESEWNEIVIENGNSAIEDARLYYNGTDDGGSGDDYLLPEVPIK